MTKKMIAIILTLAMLVTLCPVVVEQCVLADDKQIGISEENNEVASVSLGITHSAAITKNGDLYCWGDNKYGQVGNDTTQNQTTPIKVLESVASVSLGHSHSAAITKNGDLYCWGRNYYGQVGNGITQNQATPVKVLESVASVSLAGSHCAAITKNGDLYCWGDNGNGQVGNGTTQKQTIPTKVLESVVNISLAGSHCAAITKNGDLYCWGSNYNGQVGNGNSHTNGYEKQNQTTPVKVLESVVSMSLGAYHSAAITKDGDLYCWGHNYNGEVGSGVGQYQTTPIKVLENVVSVSLGGCHSAAIMKNGDLYCWGNNQHGQASNGNNGYEKRYQATPIKVLENVVSMSLGTSHSAAITKDGDLYCWGHNEFGQVGNGATKDQTTPVKVLKNIVNISLGVYRSAAIAKDGDLYFWGHNEYGQVGNGATENQTTPVKVLGYTSSSNTPTPTSNKQPPSSGNEDTPSSNPGNNDTTPSPDRNDNKPPTPSPDSKPPTPSPDGSDSKPPTPSPNDSDSKPSTPSPNGSDSKPPTPSPNGSDSKPPTPSPNGSDNKPPTSSPKSNDRKPPTPSPSPSPGNSGVTPAKPDTKPDDALTPISREEREKNEWQLNKKVQFGWKGNSLSVHWSKVPKASGYDLYAAACSTDYNKITVSVKGRNKTAAKITKIAGKRISKKGTYKVIVYAYRLVNGRKQYIGTSADMHIAGSKNKKYTNAKSIKLLKTKIILKQKQKAAIAARIVKQHRRKKLLSTAHGPRLRYTSSDNSVATVSKAGVLRAKKKGTCVICLRALNGISKQIKVTVK